MASKMSVSMLIRRLGRKSLTSSSTPLVARSGAASTGGKNPLFAVSNGSSFLGSRGMATYSAGESLANLAADNPYVDVVRYEHKNMKWTVKHVDFFSEALAIGLLENNLVPGDAMLSWLPLHFAEQHILQFACSKAGFILYHLDPAQAITDKEGAKASLKKALEVTEATCLFTQEAGNDVHYVDLVKEVIPETRIFDFDDGMPFISPRFPHLRFPIHTGFDYEDGKWGFIAYKHMLVPSENLSEHLGDAKLSGDTPLMGELVTGSDGLPAKGKILTNDEVIKSKVWPEMSSILEKDYFEVEGVGVVF